ncbi:MAG: ABC transporter ATP-binding protein [Dehalococcoidia bacterium]|nr:ABC transporter ATP-binding protein [Dehalococcoidia bacterium]
MALLELKGVKKAFGSLMALDGIDLGVNKGEIVGIVGPNGSGKTTLLHVISGYYHPTEGQVIYKGENISGLRADKIAAKGIVRNFQQNMVYWDTVTLENIFRACYLSDKTNLWQSFFNTRPYVKEEMAKLAKSQEIVNTFELNDYSLSLAVGLPHGKQRILSMAMALAADPELLLIDEPLAGMDSAEVEVVSKSIRKIVEKGVTIMLIEHNIKSVMSLCSRLIVMDFGHKIADGEPQEVMKRKDVIEAYLGVE